MGSHALFTTARCVVQHLGIAQHGPDQLREPARSTTILRASVEQGPRNERGQRERPRRLERVRVFLVQERAQVQPFVGRFCRVLAGLNQVVLSVGPFRPLRVRDVP